MLKRHLSLIFIIIFIQTTNQKKRIEKSSRNKYTTAYATGDLHVAGCVVNLKGNYYELCDLELKQK
jgi:hypothetical protein